MGSEFNLKEYLTFTKVLRHFVIGFLSGWLGVNLMPVLLFQLGLEIYTNTTFGKEMNKKIFGIDFADHSWQETLMDNILFVFGWIIAYVSVKQGLIPSKPTDLLSQ